MTICTRPVQGRIQLEPGYHSTKNFYQELLRIVGQTSARMKATASDAVMLHDLRQKVILGPGDTAQSHTPDEWIALDQLQRGTDLYCRLIDQWCCRK